jgi:hypothetical protein
MQLPIKPGLQTWLSVREDKSGWFQGSSGAVALEEQKAEEMVVMCVYVVW